ncbi:hypothetical protein AgCh_022800 [Apium graveolens]
MEKIFSNSSLSSSASPTSVEEDGPPALVKKTSSLYRGVHKMKTGKFEAYVWDKGTSSASQQIKKGRRGVYEHEEAAAHTSDLAALKYWGLTAPLNFPVLNPFI